MKILISSSDITGKGRPSFGDNELANMASEMGLVAKLIDPKKVSYSFNDNKLKLFYEGKDISDYEAVLFRRSRGAELESYELAKTMETLGKVSIDPSSALIYPTTKMIQQLNRTDDYSPKTAFVKGFSHDNMKVILDSLSFPMFAKPQNGTKGRGALKINSSNELEAYLKSNSDPTIVQEYLDIITNMRVVTIGKRLIGSTYCGINKLKVGIEKAEEIAQEVVKTNPADILGVDIVKTPEDKYYVLECNRNPDITIPASSTRYYTRHIIRYVIERVNKNNSP
jgi:glutathione synthase/RimK-type ligase-like ATP-grasp enzyme